jgi:hypothetical protein
MIFLYYQARFSSLVFIVYIFLHFTLSIHFSFIHVFTHTLILYQHILLLDFSNSLSLYLSSLTAPQVVFYHFKVPKFLLNFLCLFEYFPSPYTLFCTLYYQYKSSIAIRSVKIWCFMSFMLINNEDKIWWNVVKYVIKNSVKKLTLIWVLMSDS